MTALETLLAITIASSAWLSIGLTLGRRWESERAARMRYSGLRYIGNQEFRRAEPYPKAGPFRIIPPDPLPFVSDPAMPQTEGGDL